MPDRPTYTVAERAEALRDMSFVATPLNEAVDNLLEIGGASGIATRSMAQQATRRRARRRGPPGAERPEHGAPYGRIALEVETSQQMLLFQPPRPRGCHGAGDQAGAPRPCRSSSRRDAPRVDRPP